MQDRQARETFREAERWRDRIATDGAAAVLEFAARGSDSDIECATELEKLRRELEAVGNEPAKRRVRRRIFREIYKQLDVSREPGNQ
jgi:ribosomal 50S subunit-associated protein YjgA (DUF615 family)